MAMGLALHTLWPQTPSLRSQIFSAPVLTEEEGVAPPWKRSEEVMWGYSDLAMFPREGPNGRGRLRPRLSQRSLGLSVDIQPTDFLSKQIYQPKYIYPR